ncbi:MAG TPA: zinc-binding alcohol dehydrogenase [Gammaproteobacteria bacterium]|nr:zinc-binding alcohol dehydrogenase [Gammaproteobacteria bacterium]
MSTPPPDPPPDVRAFWIAAPGRGEIRAETLREPGEDEALVETLFSGISRGTETLVFEGRVPQSEHERMRAPFQAGRFPAPVKYGYSSVGRVVRGPDALRGRAAFCLYPHQTRYVVPADAVYALPPGVPPERAVLAANLETAVNALWDAPPRVGDAIAVVGAGAVGCLVAWLAARVPGTSVELVDVDPAKADVAAALGVAFRAPDAASGGADLVVHASASAEGLATALALAAFEATVLELSWYGDREIAARLGEGFHSRRLILKSSQVGSVPADRRARWSSRRRLELALRLLAAPELDVLISGESRFEELPALLPKLAAARGVVCHRVRY